MHHVIAVEETVRKIFTFNRTCMLFSVLALLDASIRMMRFWVFTSYNTFEEICIIVDNVQQLLSDVHGTLLLQFSNCGTIFAAVRFMPKTSVKLTWHEPNKCQYPQQPLL